MSDINDEMIARYMESHGVDWHTAYQRLLTIRTRAFQMAEEKVRAEKLG